MGTKNSHDGLANGGRQHILGTELNHAWASVSTGCKESREIEIVREDDPHVLPSPGHQRGIGSPMGPDGAPVDGMEAMTSEELDPGRGGTQSPRRARRQPRCRRSRAQHAPNQAGDAPITCSDGRTPTRPASRGPPTAHLGDARTIRCNRGPSEEPRQIALPSRRDGSFNKGSTAGSGAPPGASALLAALAPAKP